ncbi:hypothetical protein L2E82_33595 [Cichorium intybus]|uniref:Uncharacterized protein n=1 Tax=Cichorium intybus TaxID=13427 RepID=A0ACB9BKK8_CICIN|nr:hypothetical protein L2E82_33595 [Cichorium intybus]
MKSHRRLSLPENPVNFLKIILSDDTQSTGIRIPKKFTEKHGKNLLETVILKVPNGDVWRVDVQKSRGDIWLKSGWWEFAEHYDLKYGHLLMFKYEGFSIFGVIIFDTTASEIVYPPVKKDQLRNPTTQVARNSQQEVKFTKLKTVKSEEETCPSNEDQKPRIKINDGSGCLRKRKEDGRRAVEKAKANFKSHKHFFIAYMHQSYVTSRGLPVPVEFRKKYWRGRKKHNKYLLKVVNDGRQKTWEVLVGDERLRGGDWMLFIKDNGITFGDICVFQLIHKHQNVLAVTILRSTL